MVLAGGQGTSEVSKATECKTLFLFRVMVLRVDHMLRTVGEGADIEDADQNSGDVMVEARGYW